MRIKYQQYFSFFNQKDLRIENFQVDFDRTKHLAESTIKKRTHVREKLIRQEREKEEAERKKLELEELRREQER